MNNIQKGKLPFSFSSQSPNLPSKIGSSFSTHKSPFPSSSTLPSKPVSHFKAPSTMPSSSSTTIPGKPLLSQYKAPPTMPSSSSSTIQKKPVPQHTALPATSKKNTSPSMTRKLAGGAGKLATSILKTAVKVTTEVVEEIAQDQLEHNEKPKETFACYYTDSKRTLSKMEAYPGTLDFSDNQIVFSTDHALTPQTTNGKRDPQILAPWSSYKIQESKLEIKIPFTEIIEINQVNAENTSTRYIQIRRVNGTNYAFLGFFDYYKAYNHIKSLLPSSS